MTTAASHSASDRTARTSVDKDKAQKTAKRAKAKAQTGTGGLGYLEPGQKMETPDPDKQGQQGNTKQNMNHRGNRHN